MAESFEIGDRVLAKIKANNPIKPFWYISGVVASVRKKGPTFPDKNIRVTLDVSFGGRTWWFTADNLYHLKSLDLE